MSWGCEDWLPKPAKKLDRTCQQEPVLGNPLNWLEQIVLEGQTSTAGAHLKETPKINNNSTAVKGSSERKHAYKQLLIILDKLFIFERRYCHSVKRHTTEQAFPCGRQHAKLSMC